VLVPVFSGRGEQPIPGFTAKRYTVVLVCTGGGPLLLTDVAKKASDYRGRCDGSGNQVTIAYDTPQAVHLRVSAGPSSDWEARVEAR
jgi:hypothetical protein